MKIIFYLVNASILIRSVYTFGLSKNTKFFKLKPSIRAKLIDWLCFRVTCSTIWNSLTKHWSLLGRHLLLRWCTTRYREAKRGPLAVLVLVNNVFRHKCENSTGNENNASSSVLLFELLHLARTWPLAVCRPSASSWRGWYILTYNTPPSADPVIDSHLTALASVQRSHVFLHQANYHTFILGPSLPFRLRSFGYPPRAFLDVERV